MFHAAISGPYSSSSSLTAGVPGGTAVIAFSSAVARMMFSTPAAKPEQHEDHYAPGLRLEEPVDPETQRPAHDNRGYELRGEPKGAPHTRHLALPHPIRRGLRRTFAPVRGRYATPGLRSPTGSWHRPPDARCHPAHSCRSAPSSMGFSESNAPPRNRAHHSVGAKSCQGHATSVKSLPCISFSRGSQGVTLRQCASHRRVYPPTCVITASHRTPLLPRGVVARPRMAPPVCTTGGRLGTLRNALSPAATEQLAATVSTSPSSDARMRRHAMRGVDADQPIAAAKIEHLVGRLKRDMRQHRQRSGVGTPRREKVGPGLEPESHAVDCHLDHRESPATVARPRRPPSRARPSHP